MNWTQASRIIAEKVAKRHDVEVTDLLIEAVMEGLRYECDAWVRRSR